MSIKYVENSAVFITIFTTIIEYLGYELKY